MKRIRADWLAAALDSETDDCIIWPWSTDESGYGRIWTDGRNRNIHALVCIQAHGPCPDGLEAAHSCGRPSCANPRHLRWATRMENARDRVRHQTTTRGELNHHAKLTWYAVHCIRSLHAAGHSPKDLAASFGVAPSTMGQILRRESWKSWTEVRGGAT